MGESKTVSRRAFVGGALAVGVAAAPFVAMQSAVAAEGDEGAAKKQLGFLVTASKCINCQACVSACRTNNKTPDDIPARRKVTAYDTAGGDTLFVSTSCMHCEEPACVRVCSAGAITKLDTGVVTVNPNRCIGCKYCNVACPFNVPHYDNISMDKCDFCTSLGIAAGSDPHCVQACPTGALVSGWVSDLQKESDTPITQVLCSSKPSLYLA